MTSGIRLTDELVQAVRDAVDVVDIASDHTRLQKAGSRHKGLCPLHKEKTPSFSVDPAQDLFYCFGCGQGGDAIKLHQLLTGDEFPEAVEALARRYGIPLPEGGDDGRRGPDLRPVLEAAQEFFVHQLGRHRSPQHYLQERRISPELAGSYGLGYAPDEWRALLGALGRDFDRELLEAAGLVAFSEKSQRPYDRFRNRLMFPIRNPSGRLVGFGGRTLGDDRAKYVNTAETERFHKGSLLYGLDVAKRAIRDDGRVLLVEGYFDVLGAVAAGVPWAVAGMGTALTDAQAKLLGRYADEVVVGFDGDEAGERAHRRALPLLLGKGLGVRRARFGEDEDPDSLRLGEGPEAVVEAVETAADAVDEELERLAPPGIERDPQGQARAARKAVALLAPIPDRVLRFAYARRMAERLGVPVDLIESQFREQSLEQRRQQRRDQRPGGRGGSPGIGSGAGEPPPPPGPPPPGPPSGPRGAEPRGGWMGRSRGPWREDGRGPSRPDPPAETTRERGEGLWRSLEDAFLGHLLAAGDADESPSGTRDQALATLLRGGLPPEEIFFDPVARNIYTALCALYGETGTLPDARSVVATLGDASPEAATRVARYRTGSDQDPGTRRLGLGECLEQLGRRWQRERSRQLAHEMREAERRDDRERLQELLDERNRLVQNLFGTPSSE